MKLRLPSDIHSPERCLSAAIHVDYASQAFVGEVADVCFRETPVRLQKPSGGGQEIRASADGVHGDLGWLVKAAAPEEAPLPRLGARPVPLHVEVDHGVPFALEGERDVGQTAFARHEAILHAQLGPGVLPEISAHVVAQGRDRHPEL